jgi:hypothetical protein
MPRIEELFEPLTAKSAAYGKHKAGDVAFVTNGFKENGVVGFVTPLPIDIVYNFVGIVVSTFCEATVHAPPFIARGNGGSGLMVLKPQQPITVAQLGYISAHINESLRWRFSWSRQASVSRIRRLEIPSPETSPVQFRVKDLLPAIGDVTKPRWRASFKLFVLDSLYQIEPGEYHNAGVLPRGKTPLVSCGDAKNGISAMVRVPKNHIHSHKMTIAFNGMNTLTTKYHPYKFAAKDDVAVCVPRKPLRLSTEIFLQMALNQERWRYSFYRKCFMEKLKLFAISLPAKNGNVDEDTMEAIMNTSPYWSVFRAFV